MNMNRNYSRRTLLTQFGTGLGMLALPGLLQGSTDPLSVKPTHFEPKLGFRLVQRP